MNSLPELPKLPETIPNNNIPALPAGSQVTTQTTTTFKAAEKPSENNNTYIIIAIILIVFIAALGGYLTLSYFNLTSNQREQAVIHTLPTSSPTITTVSTPVASNANVTNSLLIYTPQEFKTNGNTVWSLEVPTTMKATTDAPSAEGSLVITGLIDGATYTLNLSFPIFDAAGLPSSLATWVDQDMSFLSLGDATQVERKNFKILTTIDSAILLNYPEVTKNNGTTKEFGSKKTAVLYIWKTTSRNPSQILLTSSNYDKDTASAILNHIAETFKL